jgi:transcriptional regulator with XRE-family HTH domain
MQAAPAYSCAYEDSSKVPVDKKAQAIYRLGMPIRDLRIKAKLNQAELAAKVGIGQSSLSRYEKGRVPDIETARRLAVALNVALTDVRPDLKDIDAAPPQPAPPAQSAPAIDRLDQVLELLKYETPEVRERIRERVAREILAVLVETYKDCA